MELCISYFGLSKQKNIPLKDISFLIPFEKQPKIEIWDTSLYFDGACHLSLVKTSRKLGQFRKVRFQNSIRKQKNFPLLCPSLIPFVCNEIL